MKVLKIIVDQKPVVCIECPLVMFCFGKSDCPLEEEMEAE